MQNPKILFEDPHLIVLSKPAGLLSQGEHTGDRNLVDWVREHVGRHYVGLIHRLDRNTSGLMVVAKRTKAATRLTEALQQGKICRKYLAWLVGKIEKPERWEHWLLKDEKANLTRAYLKQENPPPTAKPAVLRVSPCRSLAKEGTVVTLAEFELETGRSHQIRAQAAKQGLPLVGDIKYGNGSGPHFNRPALHSYFLSFPHPMSGETQTFEEELPPDLDWK